MISHQAQTNQTILAIMSRSRELTQR
jgi:hypothetical protein